MQLFRRVRKNGIGSPDERSRSSPQTVSLHDIHLPIGEKFPAVPPPDPAIPVGHRWLSADKCHTGHGNSRMDPARPNGRAPAAASWRSAGWWVAVSHFTYPLKSEGWPLLAALDVSSSSIAASSVRPGKNRPMASPQRDVQIL